MYKYHLPIKPVHQETNINTIQKRKGLDKKKM